MLSSIQPTTQPSQPRFRPLKNGCQWLVLLRIISSNRSLFLLTLLILVGASSWTLSKIRSLPCVSSSIAWVRIIHMGNVRYKPIPAARKVRRRRVDIWFIICASFFNLGHASCPYPTKYETKSLAVTVVCRDVRGARRVSGQSWR